MRRGARPLHVELFEFSTFHQGDSALFTLGHVNQHFLGHSSRQGLGFNIQELTGPSWEAVLRLNGELQTLNLSKSALSHIGLKRHLDRFSAFPHAESALPVYFCRSS